MTENSDTYRGFSISHWRKPMHEFDWEAVSDNFDASYEGPEDGWKTSGTVLNASTRDELIKAIDDHISETLLEEAINIIADIEGDSVFSGLGDSVRQRVYDFLDKAKL